MLILHNNRRGYIAVVTVVMMTFYVLVFSYVVIESAISYSDSVTRKEWRIQGNMNAESCLSTVALMAVKDYFLEGDVLVPEFGCSASIIRNYFQNKVSIKVQTKFLNVSSVIYGEDFTVP